jgi:hypothetical protein
MVRHGGLAVLALMLATACASSTSESDREVATPARIPRIENPVQLSGTPATESVTSESPVPVAADLPIPGVYGVIELPPEMIDAGKANSRRDVVCPGKDPCGP